MYSVNHVGICDVLTTAAHLLNSSPFFLVFVEQSYNKANPIPLIG